MHAPKMYAPNVHAPNMHAPNVHSLNNEPPVRRCRSGAVTGFVAILRESTEPQVLSTPGWWWRN